MQLPPCLLLQELCEGSLGNFLEEAAHYMYDESGAAVMSTLAPLLIDICRGMIYLHTRNIVHGGRL